MCLDRGILRSILPSVTKPFMMVTSSAFVVLSSLAFVGTCDFAVSVAHAQEVAPSPSSATDSLQVHECASRPDNGSFEGFTCFEGDYAWFFAEPEYTERARAAIVALREGGRTFEKAFGKPVPRGTVVLTRSPSLDINEALAAVEGSRWHWILSASSWGMRDSTEAEVDQPNYERTSLAPLLEQLMPELSEEQLQDTLAMLRPLWYDLQMRDMGFLVHESTHKWFHSTYPVWKGRSPEESPPNWMNEMVALATEYRDRPPTHESIVGDMIVAQMSRTKSVTALETLMTMPHPASMLLGGGSNGVSFGQYYAQLKALGDFLIERGQGVQVLGAIAESEVSGVPLAEWLPAHGAEYGLPKTMREFEVEWLRWLERQAAKR